MKLPTSLPKFIWHFIKKQKWFFFAVQFFAFGWSIDNTAWPYAFKLLIDKILKFNQDKSEVWHYLMPVLFFWVGVWFVTELMYRFKGFLRARVYPRFEADIRMSMFQYAQGHSYTYFADHFAGNLSAKINDMTQSARRLLDRLMSLFIPVALALVIAAGMFFFVNSLFALLIISWAVLHIGICLACAKRCTKLSDIHSTSRSALRGKIVDVFTNIINVKLFTRQRFEYGYISRHQEDEKIKNYRSLIAIEKLEVILSLSFLVFTVLMTWYEIYCWQHDIITVGQLVLLFNTTSNIALLTWIAGANLPELFKEIGTCQQALSIVKATHDVVDKDNALELKAKKGAVVFDHVSFCYIKGRNVFENLSVKIEPGAKVGLVGFSGSGKTTFVNLIMRFFDIQSGRISIDGMDISRATLDSLRKQISIIPQDPALFHRSLMDNIRYGKLDATDEEVFAAAKQAYCHEFIQHLPQGYDTLVGERGIKLSGGQRQRVAIARAILEKAPILILDEATSALDSVTEKHIQDALQNLVKGHTTIVVAHRLSTLREMDRILVFDNGKIIEDGMHEDLLKQNKHYTKMWRMQAGGFLPDVLEENECVKNCS